MGIFDFVDNLFKSKFQRYMELNDKRRYKKAPYSSVGSDIVYVIDEKKRDEIFEANRKSGMQVSYSIPPGSKILSRKENQEYYDKLVSDFEALSNNNSQTTTVTNNAISTSDRNEAIGYLKRGNQEFKNNQFVNAIKYYTKAIEIDSNFKEAHNNRDKAKKKL